MLPRDQALAQEAFETPESIPPAAGLVEHTVYSVPRRFGLGAMLIVTAVFAGLFALLRALGFDIVVVMAATFYLLAIALAQMCFPRSPRAASIIAGTVLFPVLAIPLCFVLARWVGSYNFPMDSAMRVGVPVTTVFLGPIAGYLSGAIGAGLFLLMDRYRPGKLAQRMETRQEVAGVMDRTIEAKDVPCS